MAEVAARLEKSFPKTATLLHQTEDEVSAYLSFPREHWTRLYSTNPLERLNREVKRRTDVVQVFPNDEAALRLAGAIKLEINDAWPPTSGATSVRRPCKSCSTPPPRRPRQSPVR